MHVCTGLYILGGGGDGDVTPDYRIAETLAKFSGSYRSGCD